MKLRLLFFAIASCGIATAQNPYIAPLGATETSGGVSVCDPRTVLAVDVTAECDVTLTGPYARYAQKFLGVRAPLTDKTTWSVKSASLSLLNGTEAFSATVPAGSQQVVRHAVSDSEFARIQPDKTALTVPALEDAAREAATTIFSLRKHRLELITGEAGENVFGEGLNAALAEIARLEQSYLELFLGKRIVTTQTRRFVVFPQSDKKQYVACRFSPSEGLLPESDLTGEMIVLQIEPAAAPLAVTVAGPKESSVVACRVADPSVCTVIAGGKELTRATLPIFEFGRTVNMPLQRRK